MSDLIDREAILKHIEKTRQGALMMDDIRKASIVMMGMNLCEEAVGNQPSAQPEQAIAEWQKDFREYINMLNIPRDDYKGIMEYINEVPSAQKNACEYWDDESNFCALNRPSAQRKGKWIYKHNIYGVAYCSECDFELHINDTPYCPNCGAEMRQDDVRFVDSLTWKGGDADGT